jgi:hypothetical protein
MSDYLDGNGVFLGEPDTFIVPSTDLDLGERPYAPQVGSDFWQLINSTISPIDISKTLAVGATATVYDEKLYVAGKIYASASFMLAQNVTITKDGSNNLVFADPNAGSKTLAQLIAGATGNVISTGTPINGQLAMWTDSVHIQGVNVSSLTLTESQITNLITDLGNKAPIVHSLIDYTNHPVSGLTTGYFMKALSTTTYGFAAHGLTKTDIGLANVTNNAQIIKQSSSTDHAVLRWNGITGDTVQDSLMTIADDGTPNIPTGKTYNINGSPHNHAGIYQPYAGNLDALTGLDSSIGFIYQTGLQAFTKYGFGGTGSATSVSHSDHDHSGIYLTANQSITISGDISGVGTTAITLTLPSINANLYGTNTFLKFAVYDKGLVLSATPVVASDINGVFGSLTANYLYASPDGSAGGPTFRALTANDIPALAESKITNLVTDLSGKQASSTKLTNFDNLANSGGYLYNNGSGTYSWATPGGGGNVIASGTPSNGQIAQWTDATHIQGVAQSSFATDAFGALTDITTNNADTGKHGFLPKLGGGTTNFLRADGTWAAPGATTPADNILHWDSGNTWYAPYAAAGAGHFDSSGTTPSGTTRLNYGGYLYATQLYDGSTRVSVSGHTHVLGSETSTSANIAYSMATYQLKYSWTAPATANAALELEATGNLSAHLVYIHQYTGTPSASTYGLKVETAHANMVPVQIIGASGVSLALRNPAATYNYLITTGAITADRTLNLPVITASDTLMTLGLNQTMTGALAITGTTKAAGFFYGGGTSPTNTTQLNYDGYLYATQLYDGGTRVSVSGHAHTLASATFANQGTTTTVLHGNAAGNPAWGAIVTNDITDANVTYGKIQNVSATSRLLGRVSVGAGVIEEITVAGDITQSGSTFTIGSGAVTEAKMTLADNTTGNASTSAHGFLKKLDNTATHYMDGTGNWSTPAGGSPVSGIWYWSSGNTRYEPYASKQSTLQHFYLGTTNPDYTTRLNVDAYFYATQLYDNGTRVLTSLTADILNYSSGKYTPYATQQAGGMLDNSSTDPTHTTRLNYDGYLYATKLYGVSEIYCGTGTTYAHFNNTFLEFMISSTARMTFQPSIADGAAALAYLFDTVNTLSTSGAKIVSFRNHGTERVYIDKDGSLNVNTVGQDAIVTYSTAYYGLKALSDSHPAAYLYKTNNALGASDATNTVEISRLSSIGNYNTTGNLLYIVDNPTTTGGSISGSILQAVIGATLRIDLNPRVTDSGTNIAYIFDTHNALTSGRKLFSLKNQGTEKFYVDYTGNAYANGTLLGAGGTTPVSSTLLYWNTNQYTPYGSRQSGGEFYSGAVNDPNATTRMNYNGYFYATQLYDNAQRVTNVSGTPSANQVAIWTGSNTLQGVSNLTYDGSYNLWLNSTSGSLWVGDLTSNAADNKVGHRTLANGNGNIYLDHKTYTGGSINFRYGAGTETGDAHTFMQVLTANGYVGIAGTANASYALIVNGPAAVNDKLYVNHLGEYTASHAIIMDNRLETLATAAGLAGFKLPHGTAPSSPVDGDVWTTTAGLYAQINGKTLNVAEVGIDEIWGNGSDGDVTISGGTTLTKNMQYNNLTINSGQQLNTAGFMIRVRGTLTIQSTGVIDCSGGAGGNGSAGTGGGSGTAPYTSARFHGQGVPSAGGLGAGASGPGSANGNGGAGSSPELTLAGKVNFPYFMYAGSGSGGGGAHSLSQSDGGPASPTYVFLGVAGKTGGAGSGAGSYMLGGGGGGGGGGAILIYAKTFNSSGTVQANGGAGGNGQVNTGNYSGNGSGGNGGSVEIHCHTLTAIGTLSASAGNAGSGGNGGVAGSAGYTKQYYD